MRSLEEILAVQDFNEMASRKHAYRIHFSVFGREGVTVLLNEREKDDMLRFFQGSDVKVTVEEI